MAKIIVGETVVNKLGERGVIRSFDEQFIYVDFKTRSARLEHTAFEKKLLRYERKELQKELDEDFAQARAEEDQKAAELRAAAEKAKKDLEFAKSHAPLGTVVHAATVRLDPSPVSLSSVRKGDHALIQQIFDACDKDIETYCDRFYPQMKYYVNYTRSRYCTGYLTKYLDTYVLRVFSRNDIYKKGTVGGVTVTQSDTTEVLRIFCVNGKTYYFSKHLSYAGGYVNTSTAHRGWHVSELADSVSLDEVVKACDCPYLNDYIAAQSVNCLQYAKLLMAAIHNNKAEIVFKHRRFSFAHRIHDVVAYLEEFTSKQIDYAAMLNVINTLPFIKRYGEVDPTVLLRLESVVKKRPGGWSWYDALSEAADRYQVAHDLLDRTLIDFLRRIDNFEPALYFDYIRELNLRPNTTTFRDYFDRNYVERHDAFVIENQVLYSPEESLAYEQAARELSWIDREENEYFIIVPKTIEDFRQEGDMQHNCVYTCKYYNAVIARSSIIVFLRKTENASFVTIEYDYETFDVLQAYGKYNNTIDPQLYLYIVKLGIRLYHERMTQQ